MMWGYMRGYIKRCSWVFAFLALLITTGTQIFSLSQHYHPLNIYDFGVDQPCGYRALHLACQISSIAQEDLDNAIHRYVCNKQSYGEDVLFEDILGWSNDLTKIAQNARLNAHCIRLTPGRQPGLLVPGGVDVYPGQSVSQVTENAFKDVVTQFVAQSTERYLYLICHAVSCEEDQHWFLVCIDKKDDRLIIADDGITSAFYMQTYGSAITRLYAQATATKLAATCAAKPMPSKRVKRQRVKKRNKVRRTNSRRFVIRQNRQQRLKKSRVKRAARKNARRRMHRKMLPRKRKLRAHKRRIIRRRGRSVRTRARVVRRRRKSRKKTVHRKRPRRAR